MFEARDWIRREVIMEDIEDDDEDDSVRQGRSPREREEREDRSRRRGRIWSRDRQEIVDFLFED